MQSKFETIARLAGLPNPEKLAGQRIGFLTTAGDVSGNVLSAEKGCVVLNHVKHNGVELNADKYVLFADAIIGYWVDKLK
ncbi:MAG: hypothetical protein LBG29_07320 [Synergistaceae bacterium]|jgi:hypothetical protein|nr:hypothetical protein [Synergistaceae bacterium]